MARVVILGAGVSGHTAALFAKRALGKNHEVVVVTPNSKWNWIPSNIWVGVGQMTRKQVTFPLAPIYEKIGVRYEQAKAVSIHPEGGAEHDKGFVTFTYTSDDKRGETAEIEYDFLINATGPKLKFEATEGLGPEGHTVSVCTDGHAAEANEHLQEAIQRMRNGEHVRFLVGTGNGMCTCQGAGFEYLLNIEHELRQHGVRDKATITYLTNESAPGDFGVAGLHLKRGGYIVSSKSFSESLFAERGIEYILGAHVFKVEPNTAHYEQLDGTKHETEFDFAMLIPPFSGVGLTAFDKENNDITEQLFAPNGFMKVDADYTKKPFEEWKASDWPVTLQNPTWSNLFAVGIAFAPPHAISKPMTSVNGTPISPTPPRTGMPSAMMGKAVALSIADMIKKGAKAPTHTASMAHIGAACVASAGASLTKGSAVAMTMFPVVPDYEKYPTYGRDLNHSFGEIGLAGHWVKFLLHYLFIYKAKAKPFWYLIPE